MSAEELKQLTDKLNGGSIEGKKEIKIPNGSFINAVNHARGYMDQSGPMFIIYKDNEPYLQLTGDGSQMKNIEDRELKYASPALSKIMEQLLAAGKAGNAEPKFKRHIERSKQIIAKREKEEAEKAKQAPQ
jgi:hypothetical protein